MTAPGMPTPDWVLENADGFYYRGYGQPWTTHLYAAATLSQELAEKLVKRYRATIEQQTGYDVNPKENLVDVGEPKATAALSSAVKLAAQDGMSLETILVQAEKAFHENETQSRF